MEKNTEVSAVRVGVDLSKRVIQVHAVDGGGRVLTNRALARDKFLAWCARLPLGCMVVMEVSSSAHHWAREFQALGHTVRLMAAQFVKPYVKTNKSDRNDAEAICEAVARPNMRFVPVNNEFDDYIARPKPNGYQSLHTVVRQPVGTGIDDADGARAAFSEAGGSKPR